MRGGLLLGLGRRGARPPHVLVRGLGASTLECCPRVRCVCWGEGGRGGGGGGGGGAADVVASLVAADDVGL
jgi:hypothetical protein